MSSIPLELFDWIAPGEIRFCSCGDYLVDPAAPAPCPTCQSRDRLEDYACDLCGKPSSMFFVGGYRCSAHSFAPAPSPQHLSPHSEIVIVAGTRLRPPVELDLYSDHEKRVAEAVTRAQERRSRGSPPKAWLSPGTSPEPQPPA